MAGPLILLRFWVFLYIIDEHSCLKYFIFTKHSQIVLSDSQIKTNKFVPESVPQGATFLKLAGLCVSFDMDKNLI